jgi:hypothetical protein
LIGSETALIGAAVILQTRAQAQPADQVLGLAEVEAFVQMRRAEAFGGEPVGDRGVAQALTDQRLDPLGQRRGSRTAGRSGRPGNIRSAWPWWPPAQQMVAWTFSLIPSAVTSTRSTTARTSFLRSAAVVVGAAHSAGMSAARARMEASSAGDSLLGRSRQNRS